MGLYGKLEDFVGSYGKVRDFVGLYGKLEDFVGSYGKVRDFFFFKAFIYPGITFHIGWCRFSVKTSIRCIQI